MATLAQILSRSLRGARVSPRQAPMIGQAVSEAVARFSPEYDQLSQLRGQANSTFRQTRGQATSAAQLISALANETQRQQNQNTNPLVARLAAYDQAPANSSSAVVAQNLGLTHAATDALLGTTARNAPIAAAQQIQAAQAQRTGDLERVQARAASVLGQAGNYISGRAGDLIGEDRKLRHDTNKQLRDLSVEMRKAKQTARTQRRAQDISVRGQDLAHQDRVASLNKPRAGSGRGGSGTTKRSTGPGSLTPDKESTYVSQANQVKDLLLHPPNVKDETGKVIRKATRTEILEGIRSGQSPLGKGIDPRVVNIGRSLADNKGRGLGPWGVHNAHNVGIRVNGRWKVLPAPRRRAPAPRGPSLGPAGPLA